MKSFNIRKFVDFIIKNKYKFVFISGNGTSGKSTFANNLAKKLEKSKCSVCIIDTDNFLFNSKIRKLKIKEYIDNYGNLKTSYLSSSFSDSYNLDLLENTIKTSENDVIITEGVGASFIKTKNSIGVFITVNKNIEFERRLKRKRNSADLSKNDFENRYEQFELFVLPLKNKFEIELESQEDFSYKIIKDKFKIF